MRVSSLLLVALLGIPAPARSQDFSTNDLFAFFAPTTTTGWTATVVRGDTKATDPLWTAVVYARRDSRIETATIGGPAAPRGPRVTGAAHALTGIASYYWQDQMTASGEVFNKRDMTAAHKTLPLGTRVKVTNLGNGRSTIVRINDRGPYAGGRIIDLSEAAADVLDMRRQGLAPVRVDVVGNEKR